MSAREPVISYPPELPVSAARDEIARAIEAHQVVVVAGATGSGKTTQLPKIALELGRTSIAHTQPRRIAARTIAERIAEELEVPLGSTVGYKVRFTDRVSDETRVAIMTDGILLNEIHRDRLLRRYDMIIVDEAHERSLNVDFLLGYLTRILPQRPDLKVVITSATIDPESFARHFSEALNAEVPVVEVSGRTYPVEIRYRPGGRPDPSTGSGTDDPPTGSGTADDDDDVDAIVAALRELDREAPGDVLVFLPGESEIRDAADAVRGAYAKDTAPTEVLPLYGRLSAAEQHRVFERPSTGSGTSVPGVRRRIVLATNVAETSLTVPGIRYVVDTGTARISRFSARAKVQRLPIEAVSQASAQQRSGRAGRTSDGIAIRLYAEADFERRPEFTEPEILRTSLASVVLQMLALGFGDVAAFPFLTPPDSRDVKAATDLLIELGAVSTRQGRGPHLTATGRAIARMPVDPRFARMIVEAGRNGTTSSVLPIVAALSIQDVRERPDASREDADRVHARFTDPTSDFLTLLNLWRYLRERQRDLSSSAFRRLCHGEYLHYVRVREWFDVHRQLRGLVAGAVIAPDDDGATHAPDAVHQALLSGLLSHIGLIDERSSATKGRGRPVTEYLGARGIRFAIFPGSGLRRRTPSAVMAAELVETSRLYARTVAAIDPAWAEPLAGDLAKTSTSEPRWSKDAGAAVATQKVTLFGVEIIPRRRVQLARLDAELARDLFLRHALVEGEWDHTALDQRLTAFVRRNDNLRRRLEKVEERERRRDILAGDEAVLAFYDARVPRDVVDVRSFEAWWRDASRRTPHLLDLSEDDLREGSARADERDFPMRWQQGDQTLHLAYRFEPGAADDGVTVVVPLALLAQLRPDGFDWQVPGLRSELIAGLLRALPKAIRRSVVPAADWAARFADELAGAGPESHDGTPPVPLADALAARIQRIAGQPVTAATFETERVPAHLRMSFRAVDARGRAVGSSRDLADLQARLADRTRDAVSRAVAPAHRPAAASAAAAPAAIAAAAERTGITTWDLGDLPDVVDTRVAGGVVRGYPALVDEGSSVALRIEATADGARRLTRDGVRRLLLLSSASPAPYVLEHLTAAEKLALAASPYSSAKALVEDARVAVADAVLTREAPAGIRTAAEFARVRDAFGAAVVDETFATVSLAARILLLARDVERGIRGHNSLTLLGALNDLRGQLAGLVFDGFLSRTGTARTAHLPRYLQGMLVRLASLADQPGRDRTRLTEFERAAAAYAEAGGTIPSGRDDPARLITARWLVEEYRVSLFAQQLGTAEPVSPQRIAKALATKE